MKVKVMLTAVVLMVVACSSWADWPQYLGPDRNSISPEKGILRSWPADGPEVLWTVSVGSKILRPIRQTAAGHHHQNYSCQHYFNLHFLYSL